MNDAQTTVLRVRKLCVDFRRSGRVLHQVSLNADRGEIVGLVGESGAGKSMLALSILGLAPASARIRSGRIFLHGRELTGLDEETLRPLRGRLAGFVFQDPLSSLNPLRRVGSALIESAMRHSGLDRGQARKRAIESLRAVELPRPETALRAYPHQFSGGQRQRIVIALALINRPALLIADEPTSALDAAVQSRILGLLQRGARRRTLLLITHDLALAARFCDRVYVMRRGRVVENGPARQVFSDPAHEYTRSLLESLPGRRALPQASSPGRKAQEPLVAAHGLTVRYRGLDRPVVDKASFAILPNETVCLVGESGSGKTTIARALAGVVRTTPGQVRFPALSNERPAAADRARHLQMVFQYPYSSLDPRWTVERIVAEPLRTHRLCPARERSDRVAALLGRVGLDPATMRRRPGAFSGGQRQRIALARALAMNPRLLIADEALSALDIRTQARILALLRDIRAERWLALLLITHDLALAAEIADRVIVLRNGKILEQGPVSAIVNTPRRPYTRELLAAGACRSFGPRTGSS